ncbi:hypothetical protein ACOMHN_055168 [Nucella lapillus]
MSPLPAASKCVTEPRSEVGGRFVSSKHPLFAKLYGRGGARYDPDRHGYRIYVGNLPPDTGHDDIARTFLTFGPIVDIWLASDPPGFGFVVFKNAGDAETAVLGRNYTIDVIVRVWLQIPFSDKTWAQLRWTGHVTAMDDPRYTQKADEWRAESGLRPTRKAKPKLRKKDTGSKAETLVSLSRTSVPASNQKKVPESRRVPSLDPAEDRVLSAASPSNVVTCLTRPLGSCHPSLQQRLQRYDPLQPRNPNHSSSMTERGAPNATQTILFPLLDLFQLTLKEHGEMTVEVGTVMMELEATLFVSLQEGCQTVVPCFTSVTLVVKLPGPSQNVS